MLTDVTRRFLETHRIRGPLLVAVSGGPDSTALLLALREIEVAISAAHVNHHLRGAESDGDEQFVRELCARFGIPLRVADGTLDPDLIRQHGIEAAARDVRHARLHEIRRETDATHIATAHQKNDQAETILMRLMTGGGIAGLRGVHPIRADGVIRPLLEVSRAEIESFLRERNIVPRIDRSNADPRFLRNRVRAILAELDESVTDSLASIAAQAREQWTILEEIVDRYDTAEANSDQTRFTTFPDEPWIRRALLHRHIHRLDPHARDVSSADLERLASQLDSLKRVSVTRDLEMLRRKDAWLLRRKPAAIEPFQIELRVGDAADIPEIGAKIQINRPPATGHRQRFQLPKDGDPTFTIRNRRDGDRFQPLGMHSEKKLKDFLIDRKIPSEFRDRIPLVLWGDKIVLLAGVEISEAFKITGEGDGVVYEVAIEVEETHQEGVQRQTDRQADR